MTAWDWVQLLMALPLIAAVALLGLAIELLDLLTPEEAEATA